MDTSILLLLLLLLSYRLFSHNNFTIPWIVAFICESWFTFTWIIILSTKWTPALTITHPDRLLQRVPELPRVDLFVTTADPVLEPPIITANTVLSLLALDYPTNKLACYVSDDGCSPLTYYGLVEASKFAKFWVPFCKKNNIQLRAPFSYFSSVATTNSEHSPEFKQEWSRMKDMYDNLSRKIQDVTKKQIPLQLDGEFAVYYNTERRNHPSIIKVILENKDGVSDGLPHLIYVSREKKPHQTHNYKAGAMNVLYIIRGMAGLQGTQYLGTNALHRRNVIYGLYPEEIEIGRKGKLGEKKLLTQQFGSSKEFIKSADHALDWKTNFHNDSSPSDCIEEAVQVAGCEYECGTWWGEKIGWLYGSIAEDVPTGLNIHRRGWRSECCTPDPIAFTGCAPRGLLSSMVQQKRWATGLTVVFFGKHSPIMGMIFGKIQFRAGLSYSWLANWGLRSVFEVCYALLPPYCIITDTSIFPKGPGLWIPIALFVIYSIHTLLEYLKIGLSIRHWWNNQRMSIITTTTAWFIGFLSAMVKLAGISDNVFEITEKELSSDGNDGDAGRFTFDESPVFVVGTTILLVQLGAMLIRFLRLQPTHSENGCGIGEFISSTYVVVCYFPYLKGLFGSGKYGIPLSTICKSAILAFVFVHLCRM
ncbi:cellulose synthase A [Vigna unguiculata]|uniref:Cellulose synthase A n=1 Tax=Vigna unguiculata TaxID=3917 RepID=A0A4D6N8B2_VIGUN|nr:cellulose synthase A [Vigna unguiculata]